MAPKQEELTERKKTASWINRRLKRLYPDAGCTLDYKNPLELYVATVLSAQCTDVRVNQVTPKLFNDCRRPEDYLNLGQADLEERIRSTGFFRNKAKSILGGCAQMIEAFEGRVPRTMDELLTIPGVGRKTANVILGNAFGTEEGIVVDTHVARVTKRLGLTNEKDPLKIERDLITLFPKKDWTVLSHRLILHGRNTCSARSPKCAACVLAERCPSSLLGEQTASRKKPRPARARTRSSASRARRATRTK